MVLTCLRGTRIISLIKFIDLRFERKEARERNGNATCTIEPIPRAEVHWLHSTDCWSHGTRKLGRGSRWGGMLGKRWSAMWQTIIRKVEGQAMHGHGTTSKVIWNRSGCSDKGARKELEMAKMKMS